MGVVIKTLTQIGSQHTVAWARPQPGDGSGWERKKKRSRSHNKSGLIAEPRAQWAVWVGLYSGYGTQAVASTAARGLAHLVILSPRGAKVALPTCKTVLGMLNLSKKSPWADRRPTLGGGEGDLLVPLSKSCCHTTPAVVGPRLRLVSARSQFVSEILYSSWLSVVLCTTAAATTTAACCGMWWHCCSWRYTFVMGI